MMLKNDLGERQTQTSGVVRDLGTNAKQKEQTDLDAALQFSVGGSYEKEIRFE